MDNQKIQHHNTLSLIQDLRQIIEQARGQVAATANYAQTMMYWHLGERINREVLVNQRAEYGKQIVSQVATQLQDEYGKKGFEPRNIRRMMQFAKEFPDFPFVQVPLAQLQEKPFLQARLANFTVSADGEFVQVMSGTSPCWHLPRRSIASHRHTLKERTPHSAIVRDS